MLSLVTVNAPTSTRPGPYKMRISTHWHIGAFFYADRILDFNLWSNRPSASNFGKSL